MPAGGEHRRGRLRRRRQRGRDADAVRRRSALGRPCDARLDQLRDPSPARTSVADRPGLSRRGLRRRPDKPGRRLGAARPVAQDCAGSAQPGGNRGIADRGAARPGRGRGASPTHPGAERGQSVFPDRAVQDRPGRGADRVERVGSRPAGAVARTCPTGAAERGRAGPGFRPRPAAPRVGPRRTGDARRARHTSGRGGAGRALGRARG